MKIISLKSCTAIVGLAFLSACAAPNIPKMIAENEAVQDYTPYTAMDEAIACAGNKIRQNGDDPLIAVGSFPDMSGQVSQSEGGNGAYVSQGAHFFTLAALDTAGLRYRNLNEFNWLKASTGADNPYGGANFADASKMLENAKLAGAVGADYLMTGATTSVAFTPGGGVSLYVNGKGADFRTYAASVRKFATISEIGIQPNGSYSWESQGTVNAVKSQIAREINIGVFSFFGDDYTEASAGINQRGALAFTDEAAHKLVTFRALGKLMSEADFAECDALLPPTPVVDEKGNTTYVNRDGSVRVVAIDGTVTNYDADGNKIIDTGKSSAKMGTTINGGVGETS